MAVIRSPNKDDNNYTIGVARIKNAKMDEWSEWPTKYFWFYLYGYKIKRLRNTNVYILQTVYSTVQCTVIHVHIKQLSLRAAACSVGKSVSNCISASVDL